MPKGNSGIKRNTKGGVGRSSLRRVDRQMKQDAARGVISMSAISRLTKNLSSSDANAVYEMLDKNYPMLEGYRYTDLGIGGYNYYKRNESGTWYRVNSWHEPYLEALTSEAAKRGFVKLQIYGHAGKVEN